MIQVHDYDSQVWFNDSDNNKSCDFNLNKFYFSFYLFINHQVNKSHLESETTTIESNWFHNHQDQKIKEKTNKRL